MPIGTGSASVSGEIAEVQRILKRSGLHYEMSSAGTVVDGPWDDVMKIIGQAHSYLHGNGVVRIQTDIRVGSRTDKKQSPQDKVDAVNELLSNESAPPPQSQAHQQHEADMLSAPDMGSNPPRAMRQSLPSNMDSVIAPDLHNVMGPPPPHLQMPPFHHHPLGPTLDPPRLPSNSLPGYNTVNGLSHKH